MSTPPIRILIADDHLVYRLGMRTLLSLEERFALSVRPPTRDAVPCFASTT